MTREIDRRTGTHEQAFKQPERFPFALFCKPIKAGEYGIECKSIATGGHLGDFRDSESAERVGVEHPHAVILIEFPPLAK